MSSSTSSAGAPPPTASGSTSMMMDHSDPRVHFDRRSGQWVYEADDGSEMEWDQQRNAWVPVLEEDLVAKQQAAYAVQGVDESVPAAPVLAREQRKRKADDSNNDSNHNNKPPKKVSRPPKANTAVFISNLPPATTISQLQTTFSKAGLILEDADGNPRIKLYHDEQGRFKGEALVVYLQEASVELALTLLDETELELGSGQGVMKVTEAEAWRKKSGAAATAAATEATGENGNGAAGSQSGGSAINKPKRTEQEKKKLTKRAEKLKQKLTDWSSDEDDNSAAIAARARSNKVVVLEGMFTLKELDDDPTLLLELKEDVREECETLGTVTNVTLYDKEEDGIITIRFKDEVSAQACIAKMNGRFFGGRSIAAHVLDPKKKYRRSGHGVSLEGTGLDLEADADGERAEKERLGRYAEWLEKGEEQ